MKTAVLSLVLLGLVSAGPIDVQQRRANSASSRSVSESQEKRACADGAFQCAGKELQRCSYSTWVTIAQCSGDNIVCSADSSAVGCVWSWSAGNTPAQSSSAPSSTETAGPSATYSPSSAVQSVVSSSSSAPRSSVVAGNLNAGVKTSTRASTSDINSTRSSAPVISTSTQASAPSVSSTSNVSSHSASARATSGGGPSGQFSAPHYVIYADNWLSKMPSASDISSYNRFILAFWMTNSGAVDNAQAWAGFDASYRQQVLNEYHNAGIALMVSAFGSTDYPTSNGADPTQTAQKLAAWVKQYGLDGVDIDYEDMDAMNGNRAESWLITFQQELRRQLPSPYIISHAPVAPWFTSGSNYPSGAYVDVHKKVGSGIDFYNVQFYNQGNGVYGDCSSLIHNSGSAWPDTSVSGINSHAGVPLNKIVIGKPLNQGDASNGYVDPSTLNTCVGQARSMGWNAGVMFWQWASGANSVMATVRG